MLARLSHRRVGRLNFGGNSNFRRPLDLGDLALTGCIITVWFFAFCPRPPDRPQQVEIDVHLVYLFCKATLVQSGVQLSVVLVQCGSLHLIRAT